MEIYKSWMIVDIDDFENPVGVYKDNDAWLANTPSWTGKYMVDARQWIDEHTIEMDGNGHMVEVTLDRISKPLDIEAAKEAGVPTYETGYKSTPAETEELRRELEPHRDEEKADYTAYAILSQTAYNVGRPDIAEKLNRIVEDEWKHHTVISEILEGLRG